MKKILAMVLVAVFAISLSITSFAEVKIPTSDFTVYKAENIPAIDGAYNESEGWGEPIVTVKGQDVYDYTAAGSPGPYKSWVTLNREPWITEKYDDGTVDIIKKMTVNLYARWDDTFLYLCFVVDGLSPFYYNDNALWHGNSIAVAFGPDDPKQNYVTNADDPNGDGIYDPGYVGNEYMLILGSSASKGLLNLGKYDGKVQQNMKDLNIAGKDYGGRQVLEVAFELSKIDIDQVNPETGTLTGKQVPFCFTININNAENPEEGIYINSGEENEMYIKAPNYNAFQIGKGIFQWVRSDIFDSLKLIFTEAEVGGNEGETGSKTGNNSNTSDASIIMHALTAASLTCGAIIIKKRSK